MDKIEVGNYLGIDDVFCQRLNCLDCKKDNSTKFARCACQFGVQGGAGIRDKFQVQKLMSYRERERERERETASPVLHRGEYALHTERIITDIINEYRKILWHALRYPPPFDLSFLIIPPLLFLLHFYALDENWRKAQLRTASGVNL